jgi:hypothetical protein
MTLAAPPTPPTRSGTPRLSEVARHLIIPGGIVSTGWPAVRDTCKSLGIGFDTWQDGAGRLILSKDKDGRYAADQIVISIPRQVGKTYLIGWIIFALCIIVPGLTVLWTAHRYKTAGETYRSLATMANKRRVKPHIESVPRGAGDQAIIFKNGSRILFGARERGFGRGFAGVDVEIFDEAQILTHNAIDDMVPATNAAPNPLLIYMGTPPKPSDPGEVFTDFRERALSGESSDTLYIEMSADRDADPMDRAQWRKANPSYPHRTDERAMLRMIKNLTRDSFPREGLGIWDETAHKPLVTRAVWEDRRARGVLPDVPAGALGIDGSPKGGLFAAGCWVDGDERHVELLPVPTDLVKAADLIASRVGRRIPVLIHSSSPAKPLAPLLIARRVKVRMTSGPDMATACGLLAADLTGGRLTHAGQKQLTDSFMGARRKPYGDAGAWVWDFGREGVGYTVAVTLAVFGTHSGKAAKQQTAKATSGRRAFVS